MNNFTTKTTTKPPESLPRSGHVNEVCKEWLVREDGALAYKLQSQEINDFYKGNRFRNAVVREDFPTALHEQIKESEQAQRQAEVYRRRLNEQEEHDKRVAKEIADKLERDLQEQQQKELQESEIIAQQMQEIYVNLPPVPPPSSRNKSRPPPRPSKKLSPEKYDQLVGNHDGVAMGGVPLNNVAVAAAAERHMQQHADDIELYVDPCDYASLREIGLPMSEIKEMSKKLKQEQKDELLARRLQAMESTGNVRQEERDRMLAIEAQDKELAKMLQEREKAKAKRAKEKARQRKSQQKEANGSSSSSTLCGTSTNCGPLLPLPQDCMSMSSGGSPSSTAKKHNTAKNQLNQNTNQPAPIHEDPIDLEAYSNPIDVLNNSRLPNGTLTNGSLGRDSNSSGSYRHTSSLHRDDDIYTLPVDSCRPGQQRPVSLHVAAETVQQLQANSMTRSEHYAGETIDSHDVAPHMKYSKSGNFDQSSSPTPPYMPIQGTRRSNSSEDRKKKSKDNKCTHQ